MTTKRKDHPAAQRLPRWPHGHADDCLCEYCEAALYRRIAWWGNRMSRWVREGRRGSFSETVARAVIEDTWDQLTLFDQADYELQGDGYADGGQVSPS